ncbi:MAG: S26 family signal peptidase, partial [Emcibacter sp.]|nr:S26 family signal peptidase [Emcibacter sp.]
MGIKSILMAIAGSCILLASVLMTEYRPRIIYNPSQSAPVGFYIIEQKSIPGVGDYILIGLPNAVKEMAIERRYVGPNIPLLKKIFATSGDHICSKDGQVYVNDQPVIKIKTHDPSGRILPIWNGCGVLKQGEYFLLNLHSDYSF